MGLKGNLTIEEINALISKGITQTEIAKQAGVSRQAINNVLTSRRRGHVLTKKQEQMIDSVAYKKVKEYMAKNTVNFYDMVSRIAKRPTSTACYYAMLKGEQKPSPYFKARVSDIIGVPIDEIFEEDVPC